MFESKRPEQVLVMFRHPWNFNSYEHEVFEVRIKTPRAGFEPTSPEGARISNPLR